MQKVVITGATGFIGIHLIKEWLKRDSQIYAIIRPGSKNADRIPRSDVVHIIELSMDGYDRLPQLIDSADCFYHLAWEGTRVPYRDDAVIQEKNYKCSIQAYETARQIGCKFFLGSGSQAEYGSTAGPVDEDHPCDPTTEYGRQKLCTCSELLRRSEHDGIRLIWTRIFSIYGPDDYPGTLIMTSIDKMMRNESIKMTEGTQLWDYLYVTDAAKAMVMFAEKECDSGIYNIASGDHKPLREFIARIAELTGSDSELLFGAVPYGSEGIRNLMPDPGKIKRALQWEPDVTFDDGILTIIQTKK